MLIPSRKLRLMASTVSVLFLIILKYIGDLNAAALPQILQVFTYASLSIAGGLITLSFCSLIGTLSDVENRVIFHLSRRISESPVRNFLAGFLVTTYLNSIRPSLAANLNFLPYMEWVTLALAIFMMHTTMVFSAKEFYIKNAETPGWKKHVQEVKQETGRDLPRIVAVLQQFVDYGTKEPLIVYLTSHLQRLGESEEGILKILEPLIDYRESARRHLHFLAFPWTKRKIAMKNRRAREVLLKIVISKLIGRD